MAAITHRQVTANLSKRQRELLLARSNLAGLVHLAGHVGALVLTGLWIMLGWPLWQVILIVHGVILIFLFMLLHECVHKTPFDSQALNSAIASICGFVLLLPAQWFTYFHLAHHRHTQDPERDPELAVPKPVTWWQYVVYLSGMPVWWSQLRVLIINAKTGPHDEFVPQERRDRVRREARLSIAIYALMAAASLAAQTGALVWLWLIPASLGQPFLRAYLLAEHTLCPHVSNMLENSRTTFTWRLVRFFTWNMPYHAEHHTYPAVPFHKLPELHQIVKQHLRETEQGYSSFHRRFTAQLK